MWYVVKNLANIMLQLFYYEIILISEVLRQLLCHAYHLKFSNHFIIFGFCLVLIFPLLVYYWWHIDVHVLQFIDAWQDSMQQMAQ